jgi:hypothetical protein
MKKKFQPFFISLIFTLFLLRLALPQYIKYLLFPIVGVWALISFIQFIRSKPGLSHLKGATKRFWLPLALILFYLFAYLQTPLRPEMLFRDTVNLMVFAIFAASLVLLDLDSEGWQKTVRLFQWQVIVTSTLASLAGIAKLYLQLKGVRLGFLEPSGLSYPQGTSLSVDDNFYTLIAVTGMVFILPNLFSKLKWYLSLVFQAMLVLLSSSALLATSRRGLIIAMLLYFAVADTAVVSVFIRKETFRSFLRNSWFYLLVMFMGFAGWYCSLFGVDSLSRNRWLAESSFNYQEVNTYVNWQVMSTESIFKGNTDYNEVAKGIWATGFDSRYPYTGWAAGNYELVSDLKSFGLTDLPDEAKGARIGAGTHLGSWDGNTYYYSKLFEGSVEKGKRYLATLFCYVSPDFDGSWVRVSTSGNVKGIRNWYYDLSRKGTWQRLQTTIYADSGDYRVYLYVCRQNDSTFNHLKGHVVFAYPEIKKLEDNPKEPLSWANSQFIEVDSLPGANSHIVPQGAKALLPLKSDIRYREKDSLWYFASGLYRYWQTENRRIVPSVYAYVSPDFNGDEVYLNAGGRIYGFNRNIYNLKQKGTWQKLYLSFTIFEGDSWVDIGFRKKVKTPADSIRGYVLFAYPQEQFLTFDPNEPLTWAGSNFKRVYPLTGNNVGIVPRNSVGLLVDSETQPRITSKNPYNINLISKIKISKLGQRIKSTIYVYASTDFTGYKLRLEASKVLGGNSASYYDLNRKGIWQKLTINNWGLPGEDFYSTTYFQNPASKDFANLKGYVVFAHPSFKVLNNDPRDPETYTSSTYIKETPLDGNNAEIVPAGVAGARYTNITEGRQWKDVHHSTTEYWSVMVNAGDSVFASVYCYVSPDFNGSEARLELRGKVSGQTMSKYNINVKGEWVLLQAKAVAKENGRVSGVYMFSRRGVTDFSTLTGHITFAYPQLVVKPRKTAMVDSKSSPVLAGIPFMVPMGGDSIPDNFQLSMSNDHFAGPRVDRWRYAWYLFKNEYSFVQKLVGGGFGYTIKFARKFHPEDPKRDYDYPHNPFLSVLLYSGLIGLVLYIWFFSRTVYLYFLYRKEYWTMGIVYAISFFYSFFSANSPFEPAFFGVMSVFPFILKYCKSFTVKS